jgi:hypothetical protein
MNRETFSKEWDSLSSEQQEAFKAWVKAKLKADKAQEKFIDMYLMKEFREFPEKDLQRDLLIDYDIENINIEQIETFVKKIFIDVLVLLTGKCDYCKTITNSLERYNCYKQCMNENIAQVEVDIN